MIHCKRSQAACNVERARSSSNNFLEVDRRRRVESPRNANSKFQEVPRPGASAVAPLEIPPPPGTGGATQFGEDGPRSSSRRASGDPRRHRGWEVRRGGERRKGTTLRAPTA
jgi:hypothetical protein